MVEKLTSGTTGALGKIQMDGFSADNLSSLESSISSSTTTALGQIQMDGFDPNNIPSDLTNSINTGVTSGQQKQPPILKEIVAISSPTTDTTPSYTFSSSKAGTITYEEVVKVQPYRHLQVTTQSLLIPLTEANIVIAKFWLLITKII